MFLSGCFRDFFFPLALVFRNLTMTYLDMDSFVYTIWSSFSFLNLLVCVFCHIWEVFSHFFLWVLFQSCLLCLLLQDFMTWMLHLFVWYHGSLSFCSFLKSLSPLCCLDLVISIILTVHCFFPLSLLSAIFLYIQFLFKLLYFYLLFNLLRLILCPSMWSILGNILCALEKNINSAALAGNVL